MKFDVNVRREAKKKPQFNTNIYLLNTSGYFMHLEVEGAKVLRCAYTMYLERCTDLKKDEYFPVKP